MSGFVFGFLTGLFGALLVLSAGGDHYEGYLLATERGLVEPSVARFLERKKRKKGGV